MTDGWWLGRMIGFDVESTHPDPFEARIVTAAVVSCGGGLPTQTRTWLVNPGIPIPAEATAVHGITDEEVQAKGLDAAEAVRQIVEHLAALLEPGWPLVIMNARYDLTVLACEARRYGIELPLSILGARIIDPRVIDPFLDRYRRSYPHGMTPEQAKERGVASSRTLTGLCLVYGANLDGAHDASYDAVAACRIAYRMGSQGQVVRRVRNRRDAAELAELQATWERVRYDLDELHDWQVEEALRERARFAGYKRSQGEHEEADRIESERGWPFLELPDEAAA